MRELAAMAHLARLSWSGSNTRYVIACQRYGYRLLRSAGHDRLTARRAAQLINGRRNQSMADVLAGKP